jgi:hypothetical protein
MDQVAGVLTSSQESKHYAKGFDSACTQFVSFQKRHQLLPVRSCEVRDAQQSGQAQARKVLIPHLAVTDHRTRDQNLDSSSRVSLEGIFKLVQTTT